MVGVPHSTAVDALKRAGHAVTLCVKRKKNVLPLGPNVLEIELSKGTKVRDFELYTLSSVILLKIVVIALEPGGGRIIYVRTLVHIISIYIIKFFCKIHFQIVFFLTTLLIITSPIKLIIYLLFVSNFTK